MNLLNKTDNEILDLYCPLIEIIKELYPNDKYLILFAISREDNTTTYRARTTSINSVFIQKPGRIPVSKFIDSNFFNSENCYIAMILRLSDNAIFRIGEAVLSEQGTKNIITKLIIDEFFNVVVFATNDKNKLVFLPLETITKLNKVNNILFMNAEEYGTD